ncbi:MAG TPA: hypothetical protein VG779_01110 [Actinomycetota bacterium]|nr:hypothetical protein [Actinomycetota bacterium]
MTTAPPDRRLRVVVIGLILATAYLLVGGLSFRGGLLPRAPVLDGLQPPAPYQWVKPPRDRVKDNKPPSGATGTIPLTSLGSAGSHTTPDGQAQILFDSNSVPVPPGQTSVSVTIAPLDPDKVGPPPSGGYHYDSNAYKFDAVYEPSGQPLTTMTVTIVMSFATTADHIFRWNGSGWDALPTTPAGQNQLFAPTDRLGIFVAAGTAAGRTAKQVSPAILVVEVAAPFAVIAVVLVVLLGRRRRTGSPVSRRR